MLLTCEIVTPAERLFEGEAAFVALPGESGEMGIMPGHVPLVSTLGNGEVRIKDDIASRSPYRYVISGGYVEIYGDRIIILADHARVAHDIRTAETQKSREEAQAALDALDPDDDSRAYLEGVITWCDTQLRYAKTHKIEELERLGVK